MLVTTDPIFYTATLDLLIKKYPQKYKLLQEEIMAKGREKTAVLFNEIFEFDFLNVLHTRLLQNLPFLPLLNGSTSFKETEKRFLKLINSKEPSDLWAGEYVKSLLIKISVMFGDKENQRLLEKPHNLERVIKKFQIEQTGLFYYWWEGGSVKKYHRYKLVNKIADCKWMSMAIPSIQPNMTNTTFEKAIAFIEALPPITKNGYIYECPTIFETFINIDHYFKTPPLINKIEKEYNSLTLNKPHMHLPPVLDLASIV